MRGRWEDSWNGGRYIDELAGVVDGGFLADLVHDLRFGIGGCVVEIHDGGGV